MAKFETWASFSQKTHVNVSDRELIDMVKQQMLLRVGITWKANQRGEILIRNGHVVTIEDGGGSHYSEDVSVIREATTQDLKVFNALRVVTEVLRLEVPPEPKNVRDILKDIDTLTPNLKAVLLDALKKENS